MSLPSITLDQQHAVNEQRRAGRTDRRREKDQRFWASMHHPDRILRGWRPTANCVISRPDAPPLKSLPRVRPS